MSNKITTAEAIAAFTLFLSFRESLEKTDIDFSANFTHENNAVIIDFKICSVPFNATYTNDAVNFAADLEEYCEMICEPIQNQWHNDRCADLQSEYWPSQITVDYEYGEYIYSDPLNEDGNLENDVTKLNMSAAEIEDRFFGIFGKF